MQICFTTSVLDNLLKFSVGKKRDMKYKVRIKRFVKLLQVRSLQPLFCLFAGNGVVIHVPSLFEELEKNELKGNKYLKTNPFSIELIYHKTG